MMGTSQFNDQLNDCLERMATGEVLEECAAIYPDSEEELLPLLRAASATIQVVAAASLRPEAKARGLAKLNRALEEMAVRRSQRWLRMPRLFTKPVAAGLVAIMMTSVVAVGASVASASSVPGEPLYRVKTMKEDISMMMPKSEVAKARHHFSLARERGREVSVLVGRGKMDMADQHGAFVTMHLYQSAVVLGVRISMTPMEMPGKPMQSRFREEAPKLKQHLERDGLIIRAMFNSRMRSLSPDEQNHIKTLMHRWELSYWGLIAALDANSPQAWPLWMTARPVGR